MGQNGHSPNGQNAPDRKPANSAQWLFLLIKRIHRKARHRQKTRREEPDHTKRVADYTRGLSLVTGALVVVGICQLVASILAYKDAHSTGIDTHNLAVAASDQAEAMSEMAATESGELATLNRSVEVARISAEAAMDESGTAKTSMVEANRAWLHPLHMGITMPIVSGQPIRFEIDFRNTGKQPARDFNVITENGVIDPPPEHNFNNLPPVRNDTCKMVIPSKSGIVIYATDDEQMFLNSMMGKNPMTATDSIINTKQFYMVKGCAAYRTFNTIHHTGFCFVLQRVQDPQNNSVSGFVNCKNGYTAD